MSSEALQRADFSAIRYAQCWEDADILLPALDIQPGETAVSIASAGDNTLAMLTASPARVVALDLSPAQIACLELRVAAYTALEHAEVLELLGSRPSARREELYAAARKAMGPDARSFWDARPGDIAAGAAGCGRFERYFETFRTRVLPLVHSRAEVERLMAGGPRETRLEFYERVWDTRRWRALFRVFFSRFVMGRMGRDPSFFRYVEGSVADRLLQRARYGLTELDPAENPYLHWILTGTHGEALPMSLRAAHFDAIREGLPRLEWRMQPIEDFVAETGENAVDAFNLSDVFEYMSEENAARLVEQVARAGRPRARLVYWNMLAARSRPESLAHLLTPLKDIAEELFAKDKAFFYSAFRVEEVAG